MIKLHSAVVRGLQTKRLKKSITCRMWSSSLFPFCLIENLAKISPILKSAFHGYLTKCSPEWLQNQSYYIVWICVKLIRIMSQLLGTGIRLARWFPFHMDLRDDSSCVNETARTGHRLFVYYPIICEPWYVCMASWKSDIFLSTSKYFR